MTFVPEGTILTFLKARCFCELCWRTTEYSTNLNSPQVIKRLLRGNAKIVGLTQPIRSAAKKKADAIVKRYEQALVSSQGHQTASRLYDKYCDSIEIRNDRSVAGFRDCVERITLYQEWAKHGELAGITRKPGQDETAAKPSKIYCEFHNPRRSDEARRAYQRDRRFKAEYKILMDAVWSQGINSGSLPAWGYRSACLCATRGISAAARHQSAKNSDWKYPKIAGPRHESIRHRT